MSTESSVTASLSSLPAAATRASSLDAHPRHALPGDWVRPFGDKVTALQRRRRSAESARSIVTSNASGSALLSMADGSVVFQLTRTPCGLLIERIQHRPAGTVLRQSMLLVDQGTFERWCEGDPVRFGDPALWARLHRHGDDFFGQRR
jgi:hypothetical protein